MKPVSRAPLSGLGNRSILVGVYAIWAWKPREPSQLVKCSFYTSFAIYTFWKTPRVYLNPLCLLSITIVRHSSCNSLLDHTLMNGHYFAPSCSRVLPVWVCNRRRAISMILCLLSSNLPQWLVAHCLIIN